MDRHLKELATETARNLVLETRSPIRWSKPIEDEPNPRLARSAVQVCYVKDANGTCASAPWFDWTPDLSPVTIMIHRIAMGVPITWEGGECPAPGDWEMHVQRSNGTWYWATADRLNWSKPFTFILTSDGETWDDGSS